MSVNDLKERVAPHIFKARVTVLLSLALLSVYGLQLLVAGSLRSGAAYHVTQTYVRPNAGLLLVLSPLLHSSHGHILGNLTLLIPSGVLTEQAVSRRSYLAFVYVAGALANFLPPFLGLGGFGVGISSAFYGLWAFVGVAYLVQTLSNDNFRRVVFYAAMSLLGLVFTVRGILQWAGLEPVAPGTAKGAHLLGLVFGFGWAVGWFVSSRLGWDIPLANRI